ncbi:MAG TPA: dienelactone hydrolase family protein [Candidatus Binatia bacterium]
MPLYVSVPESGGPVPGIVVVHGQSGLENFIKNTTHMLALQGYAAVAPNLYHRDAPDCKDDNPTRKSRLRDAGIINDINAAIGFLCNTGSANYRPHAAALSWPKATEFFSRHLVNGDSRSPH